jgi:hypothetical protein
MGKMSRGHFAFSVDKILEYYPTCDDLQSAQDILITLAMRGQQLLKRNT